MEVFEQSIYFWSMIVFCQSDKSEEAISVSLNLCF